MKKRTEALILPMKGVGIQDVALVGGKNASLGEMLTRLSPKGVRIPDGFIVTAYAYRQFISKTKLDEIIKRRLEGLNVHNVRELAKCGKAIREAIRRYPFPAEIKREIIAGYRSLEKQYGRNVDVAVRSSATAEDLPDASFAGEHDTYLNVRGAEHVMRAVRNAMASLFTNRAISYREDKGFKHLDVALSVGVQKMVRADKGVAGVLFTLDTESGFRDVVLINGTWGLGELLVQGEVTPDEFWVFKKPLDTKKYKPIIGKKLGVKDRKIVYASSGKKGIKLITTSRREQDSFVLSDNEILTLARWGTLIEQHYSKQRGRWMPMDIEWAKDGITGKLYIVQARPETVHALRDFSVIEEYRRTGGGTVLTRGASVGSKIAHGKARVIFDISDITKFRKGEVLVTDMTDPDWEPIMKIASAIVTDKGGRTSHAAIVSRELGIPCVVGTGDATTSIRTGQVVTVDTTGDDGIVLSGKHAFKIIKHNIKNLTQPKTKMMVNIATPETAFEKSFLPHRGVGLAREEFIIASSIGIHPMALFEFNALPTALRRTIGERTRGWKDKRQFYVDNLAFGIARISVAFYPYPVIVRFSDFKTNEYRTLLGGERYEPEEENPMLGWRGASRYYHPQFKDAFVLECRALAKVRYEMGLTNMVPMVPFCRTVEEGKRVVQLMAKHGLSRRKDRKLKIYVMCEIPSNVIQADAFLDVFDGMSIGSNDLTQLVLGIDRDSELIRDVGNENNEAVKEMVRRVIRTCRKRSKYVGICGQAPSDYPEFVKFLVSERIESISLSPDAFVATVRAVYHLEQSRRSSRTRKPR